MKNKEEVKMHEIEELVGNQRTFFNTDATKSPDYRLNALKKLKRGILENERALKDALWQDLHKSEFESYETEIGILLEELNCHIKNVKRWARPLSKPTPMALFPSRSEVYPEPFGLTLIIAPWNYPVQLLLNPLVGAISAGNCAVLKPSPYTANVSKVMEKIIKDNFPPEYISLVQGNRDVNQMLLDQKFDYIFFTGSPSLGKIVMRAASEHLTPLTLELGGKSPCIVDSDANIETAAKRIVWGKFLNAGQTCIAPDYMFAHKSIKKRLMDSMARQIEKQFGQDPKKSPDFPRIVNQKAFDRLRDLLANGHIVCGGETDRDQKYIAPTIIDDIKPEDQIMQQEIFGPIMPVMEFEDISEVIDFVKGREKPLAFYYFSKDLKKARAVLNKTTSGGGCINDVIIHIGNNRLPFGGVGNSGMGKYHGKLSFDAFSNMRSIVRTPVSFDIPIKYAPYKGKIKLLRMFLG